MNLNAIKIYLEMKNKGYLAKNELLYHKDK